MCPGAVKTELSRSMQENSFVARIAAPIFMNLVGKSPDYGARIYLTGALAGPKEHVSYQTALEGAGFLASMTPRVQGHHCKVLANVPRPHRESSCVTTSQTRSTPAGLLRC